MSFDDDDDGIDGLDVSVIASIPIFVHKSDHICNKLECVICLSVFEENDIGRHLPSCNHAFHVQCIDKWLRSHSSCPICRAVVGSKKMVDSKLIMAIDDLAIQERTERSHVHNDSPGAENEGTALEVVIEMPTLESNSECNNVHNSSQSSPTPAAPPQPQLCTTGYYLKRILSMNRSENKVFPSSSNVNDMNV
ncbi:Ring-h2 finger protein atl2 [Thalictrum thalictroides]|uniref:RING-type E3 ubiquitin transferase n=1 Tax=Thalictrum thalictroides TaxID=46969 RepID=A0A7J6XD20_THATH|nr:Ring-h2 finger protein atl2 [Thalictrum thalictroides]